MAESAAPVGGRVVDLDGTIHYDFQGHVTAAGLDLTAAPTFSTPETLPVNSVIDWVQADGAIVARIWGRAGGVLRVAGDSEVRARVELGGGLGIERTVIRDDGFSDFAGRTGVDWSGTFNGDGDGSRYVNTNEYTPGSEARQLAGRVGNLISDLQASGIID
jgi:hypothetical protein